MKEHNGRHPEDVRMGERLAKILLEQTDARGLAGFAETRVALEHLIQVETIIDAFHDWGPTVSGAKGVARQLGFQEHSSLYAQLERLGINIEDVRTSERVSATSVLQKYTHSALTRVLGSRRIKAKKRTVK